MKIHSMDDELEMEFNSPETGSAYFREMYSKEDKGDYIERLFLNLDSLKQQMVITLIHGLLPKAKKDAFLGTYLQAFLDDYKITYGNLAKYITAYINCSVKWQIIDKDAEIIDVLKISSKLQRFLKSIKAAEDNKYFELVSGFFSVSPSVLITGKGERYSIDLERLLEIIIEKESEEKKPEEEKSDEKEWNADTFLDEHFLLEFDGVEEQEEAFKKYIHHNATVFAEIVEEQLGIKKEDILVVEECWVELENFPIKEYYNRLTNENKEVVKDVLFLYECQLVNN